MKQESTLASRAFEEFELRLKTSDEYLVVNVYRNDQFLGSEDAHLILSGEKVPDLPRMDEEDRCAFDQEVADFVDMHESVILNHKIEGE